MRRLAYQVLKEDATPISPQYLFDIEVHHRVPAPHVLHELAWVLELDYDALLALARAVDTVVREYLQVYPQHTTSVIKFFRTAEQPSFTTGIHCSNTSTLEAREAHHMRRGADREDGRMGWSSPHRLHHGRDFQGTGSS